jgi:hypothetical protein
MDKIDFCFKHKPAKYVSIANSKITSRCKFCNENIIMAIDGDWIGYNPKSFNRGAPCKNCSDRHFRCHSTCPKYINFKNKNEKIRNEIHMHNEIENINHRSMSRRGLSNWKKYRNLHL